MRLKDQVGLWERWGGGGATYVARKWEEGCTPGGAVMFQTEYLNPYNPTIFIS